MSPHPDIVPLRTGTADLSQLRVERLGAAGSRLTPIEGRLLGHLAARSPEVVSKQELLEVVWGYAPGVHTRTVAVTVHTLRTKIEAEAGAPQHIVTIRGEGYRFVPAPASAPVMLGRIACSAGLDPALRHQLRRAQIAALGYDDPAAALAMLEELSVDDTATRILRAAMLSDLGRLDEAAAVLSAAQDTASPAERPRLLVEAALVARRSGDIPHAVAALRQAIRSTEGPGDVRGRAWIRLGAILLDQGQIEAGFAALRRARALLEPLNAHRLLAIAWGEEGLYRCFHGPLEMARDALLTGITLAVQSQSMYVERANRAGLALALRLLGDADGAERERRRGAALRVGRWEEPGLFGVLAQERAAAGDLCAALSYIEQGIARHAVRPNDADHAQLVLLRALWTGADLGEVVTLLRAHNPCLYRMYFTDSTPEPVPEVQRLLRMA